MLLSEIAAAPVIVALVAVVGGVVPSLPRRAYPAVAVTLGVGWQCAVAALAGGSMLEAALTGVVTGLAACGLYAGAVKPLISRGSA